MPWNSCSKVIFKSCSSFSPGFKGSGCRCRPLHPPPIPGCPPKLNPPPNLPPLIRSFNYVRRILNQLWFNKETHPKSSSSPKSSILKPLRPPPAPPPAPPPKNIRKISFGSAPPKPPCPPPMPRFGRLSRWIFVGDFFYWFLDELGHFEHNTFFSQQ